METVVDNYAKYKLAKNKRKKKALDEALFGPTVADRDEQKRILEQHVKKMQDQKKDEEFKNATDNIEKKKKESKKKIKEFASLLRMNLLSEAMSVVFNQVADIDGYTDQQKRLGYGIIEGFVKEQGYEDILNNMRTKNVYLSQYANAIDDTYNSVMEACANKSKCLKDDEADICYTLDKNYADKFITTIQNCTPNRLSDIISKRVEDAVTSFVDKNSADKQQIKDIYTSAKTKIDSTKNESYINEYNIKAKRNVSKVYRENNNLYGAMVLEFSKDIIKNPKFKETGFITESGINVPKLLNSTRVMYTVLEMVNTMGIVDIDTDFVKNNILKQ